MEEGGTPYYHGGMDDEMEMDGAHRSRGNRYVRRLRKHVVNSYGQKILDDAYRGILRRSRGGPVIPPTHGGGGDHHHSWDGHASS